MDGCERGSIIIELGRVSLLTRGGPIPPSIRMWPLRVYAGFQGDAPRYVRGRTARATERSSNEGPPPWTRRRPALAAALTGQ
jgi:hypothetical protein